MKPLDDAALSRLREAVLEPDLSATRYRLISVAGKGVMGTVYVAEDSVLSRRVALKVLEPMRAPDPFLRREAQVLARLEHPGIVPVHDAGELPDGRRWYAMKLVQGERLDHALRRKLGLGERLRIFRQVCETVAFAHAQGVLHRDLKPQNVMLGPFGEVLLLDWGLALLGTDGDDGARVGTEGFRAPEARGDARADVYSLGAILGQMRPLPPALEAIARKATATLDARYPSAAALADDIDRFVEGDAVTAVPEGPFRKIARMLSRHRVAAGIVAAYVLGRGLLFFLTGR
ncbi:MAG: serine/threonine-protein kinase [Myxococcales bacterium]